jgi:hypothetical protein
MPLILGVLFLSTTGCISSVTEPGTRFVVPESTIFHKSVALHPAVSATIRKIQFFDSGRSDMELRRKRIYQGRFAQETTRTIYTEIHLEYPQVRKRIDFPITLVCSRADGTTFRIEEYTGRIKPGWSSSDHWIGVGYHRPGKWDAGIYKVDIYVNGGKVATSYFEIYQ